MIRTHRPKGELRYRVRSERQRAAVCHRLLAVVGLTELWGDAGPKSTAWRPLVDTTALPTFEMLFLLAAWHVWADDDLDRLIPAFERLDPRLARGIRELERALRDCPGAIDQWLATGALTG